MGWIFVYHQENVVHQTICKTGRIENKLMWKYEFSEIQYKWQRPINHLYYILISWEWNEFIRVVQ